MDELWRAAPCAALRLWGTGPDPEVEPNDAARAWGQGRGMDAAAWRQLAQACAPGGTGPSTDLQCGVPARSVRCRRVSLPDGALLWLEVGAEPEAEARRERIERALELAGVSVWRIDMATQRIHFNAVGSARSGTPVVDGGVPLSDVRALVHPNDIDAMVAADEAACAGEQVVDVIARYAMPGQAEWRTYLARRVAERDGGGAVTGLAGVSMDLTALMAERARADALTERARLTGEALGVGYWSRDRENASAYWDEQMYRIHHRAPVEGAPSLDEWLQRHVHEADRAWVAAAQARDYAAWTETSEIIFRIPTPEGGQRWVQAWTRRVRREGRHLSFGMHMDVTERHLAALASQRERDRDRFAIEAAEVGVWEHDVDTGERHWNEAMFRLRGLDPSDPRPIGEIAAAGAEPGMSERMAELLHRHIEYGEPYRAEWQVRLPDGTLRWLAVRGRLLASSGRASRVMAGINTDITERKQADALREEVLREAQASREKSTFLARVSHELRTPMNAIIGFTDLLLQQQGGPSTAAAPAPAAAAGKAPRVRRQADRQLVQRLGYIRSSARHLMTLIDDILQLSRLGAGQTQLQRQPVRLETTLADALRWAAEPARAAQVTLHVEDLRVPAVLADAQRLAQIVSNLLTNAIKYNQAGGWVRVSARLDADAARVGVVVADGGRGIAREYLGRVFDPFERAGAEHDGVEGTGIGLTIARQLALGMGGTLEVHSTLGQGSEFTLWLQQAPAGAAVARVPTATAPAPPPPAGADASSSRGAPALVVLCVEDDPVNLQLLRELLALRASVALHEATTGLDALAVAQRVTPDVVLLDMQLPDIGGMEVMQRLRALPQLERTRFIALSANAMPDHVAQSLAAGFDAYWTKPIDFVHFLGEIDQLVLSVGQA